MTDVSEPETYAATAVAGWPAPYSAALAGCSPSLNLLEALAGEGSLFSFLASVAMARAAAAGVAPEAFRARLEALSGAYLQAAALPVMPSTAAA